MTQYNGEVSGHRKKRAPRPFCGVSPGVAGRAGGQPLPLVNTMIIPFCRLALYDAGHVGLTAHFHEVTDGMTRCAWLRNLIGTWLVAAGWGAAEPSLIPWPANVTTGEGV